MSTFRLINTAVYIRETTSPTAGEAGKVIVIAALDVSTIILSLETAVYAPVFVIHTSAPCTPPAGTLTPVLAVTIPTESREGYYALTKLL